MTVIKNTPQAGEEIVEPYVYTSMAIFAGSWSELNVLDFSMLNLRFVKFRSQEFDDLITDHQYHENQLTRLFADFDNQHLDIDRLQALVPIDFNNVVKPETLWLVRNILLIIFPSDITINRLIKLQLLSDKVGLGVIESYSFNSTGESLYDNYLVHYEHEIESINQFIPVYLERYDKIPYLQNTIDSYLGSFFQNFKNMEYLSLCIAMESIIDGKSELIYRIRRNLSILLSGDVELGKIVFKNISEVYELRSSIVHSSNVLHEKFQEYLPYLRNVISRLIVELISIDIKDLTALNLQLTAIGFGDRNKLSERYVDYRLSTSVRSNALAHELSKYKK